MTGYFDTSAIVPLLVMEPGSDAARRLFDSVDIVTSSRLLYAEARAALAAARRAARLDLAGLRDAVAGLEDLYASMERIEPSERIVRRAGDLAELHRLRGYDAVHLASAEAIAEDELVLVAGDHDLIRAAAALGFATAELI
ncbi:MAG: type II toxin-antitoxin system VapC family toxin [Actinobacteria bacterium]|nr:type II toxin-antitoxin system VapC family toxin [Actinomycetota bacterium]